MNGQLTKEYLAFIDPVEDRALRKKYRKDGDDISNSFCELSQILEENSSFTSSMLCLNDASIFDLFKNYHSFLRVFGGRSAPKIDNTFTQITQQE